MMRENLTWPKRMVLALTIFSLFFGAGNLIFPVHMGVGVFVARTAVGGPAGMPDAAAPRQGPAVIRKFL